MDAVETMRVNGLQSVAIYTLLVPTEETSSGSLSLSRYVARPSYIVFDVLLDVCMRAPPNIYRGYVDIHNIHIK